ncbi:MAG: hypothetical protein HQ503_16365 [Rhodospirillales bacterium]|nr:hypothetical protein [Rhodospirillales bacterium]
MKNLTRIVVIIIIALVVGTGVFLTTWDIPAPVSHVEKVIPNDRFQK